MGVFQPSRPVGGTVVSVLLLFTLLPSVLLGQSPVFTLRNPVKDQFSGAFGQRVAVLDDLDGDGVREFLVSSPYDNQRGSVSLFSGKDQRLLLKLMGDNFMEFFGGWIANAGNVDADGVSDFRIGALGDDLNGSSSGSVQVYSGRTFGRILVIPGAAAGNGLGSVVAGVGDVDSDGHADFIASAPIDNTGGYEAGSAKVFSGADGSVLFTFYGTRPQAQLEFVASAGDVNADGIPDFAVGEGRWSVAQVFSGRDGSLLLHLINPLPSIHDFYALQVNGLGDLDQDGFGDAGVGSFVAVSEGSGQGVVLIFCGRTGKLLYHLEGDANDGEFAKVTPWEDVDGDGVPDFLVGAPGFRRRGSVKGFSGRDGRLLFALRSPEEGILFAAALAGYDDLNGDGIPEILVGIPGDHAVGHRPSGTVAAFSTRTLVGLQEPVPGRTGMLNTLVGSAPGPGRTLLFYAAVWRGYTPLAGCFPGAVLRLQDPKPVGSAVTGVLGKAILRFFVPARFPNRGFWFQAVESSSCFQSQGVFKRFF